jgi:tetratricopeptide (TPR) repeat protein
LVLLWVDEMRRELKRIRDRKILEIVRGLLLSEISFQEIFKKYRGGHLRFSKIGNWVDDKGQSLLYNLKEQSHSLFRYKGKGSVYKKEWLLDLVIGSIFHEAMKLRENIYQMEIYQPRYLQYKLKAGKSLYEQDYLHQFERIISKAKQGVLDGMAETRSLFHDAMAQLIDLLKENAKNQFLARFLIEHQMLLRKVYGFKRTKDIFNIMFRRGFRDAYFLVGCSYLDSEHYDLSSLYFSKAFRIDPSDKELRFLRYFSLGMNAYYKNAYSKALTLFAKLAHLKLNGKLKKDYVKKMEEVCQKIYTELKEEKKLKIAKRAHSLADQMKKML